MGHYSDAHEFDNWTKKHPKELPGDDYSALDTQVGMKHDTGKPRFDLVDPHWLESVVEVLTQGAEKYSEDNWKKVDRAEQRYLAAALRYLNAYQKGETFDEESGLPHTSHAACCLMFLFYLAHKKESPF